MSLRVKLTLALFVTGLAAVAMVGGLTHYSVTSKFDTIRSRQAADHFYRFMTAYLTEYGDWDTAIKTESFDRFVQRKETEDGPQQDGERPSDMLERMPPAIDRKSHGAADDREARRPAYGPGPEDGGRPQDERDGRPGPDGRPGQPGPAMPRDAGAGAGTGADARAGADGQPHPRQADAAASGQQRLAPPDGQFRAGQPRAGGAQGMPRAGGDDDGRAARDGIRPPPPDGIRPPPPDGQPWPQQDGMRPPPSDGMRPPRDGQRPRPGDGAPEGRPRDGERPPQIQGGMNQPHVYRAAYGPVMPQDSGSPGVPGHGAAGQGTPATGAAGQRTGPGTPGQETTGPTPGPGYGDQADPGQAAGPGAQSRDPAGAAASAGRNGGPLGRADRRRSLDGSPFPPGPDVDPAARGRGGRPGGPPPYRFVLADKHYNVLLGAGQYGPGSVLSGDSRAKARPIVVKGETVAYVSTEGVATPSKQEQEFLDAMESSLLAGAGAAAALALGLGLLLAGGLSRRLSKLTGAVRAMQGGALRQQVPVEGKDEVAALAGAFNDMSEQLARSHEELKASHQTILEQAEQLKELSIRDALTSLYNRRHFDEQANTLYHQAVRHKRPISLVIGDIDFFKKINDNFSHATGDAVLRHVGSILRQHVRLSDLVARYGGEEFVLALPDTDANQAAALCNKLRSIIESHPWHEVHPNLKVTMSMGVFADYAVGTAEAMLQKADELLYQAKETGRNRVCHA